MKRTLTCMLLAFFALLSACAAQENGYETEFFAMDTVMQVHLYGAEEPEAAAREIIRQVSELEKTLSVTDAESEVARLNTGEKRGLSSELRALLDETLALCERTGGCLDPTIYPIVKLWGFTTGEYHVPDRAELDRALPLCGIEHIHYEDGLFRLDRGSALDFGAVGKGYCAELCRDQLAQAGITGILTLGGNVQTVGEKPDGSDWRIGITDPTAPEKTIAALSLRGSHAVVTSGGYQRYFDADGERYCHIIDPATGQSAHAGFSSVTIVSDSALLADALSTALYVMGPERAEDFWRRSNDFEAVLITEDGELLVTQGLSDCISAGIEFRVIER